MNQELVCRCPTLQDLDDWMRVEESWPEGERASRAQLEARLRKSPRTCWTAQTTDGGQSVGFITAFPIVHQPGPCTYDRWDKVTADGFFPDHFPAEANGVYIASSVIEQGHRGQGCYEILVQSYWAHLRSLPGMRWVVTGAVIPGYDAYCQRHGEIAAVDYALMRRAGRPIDPFLRKLEALGLTVPGPDYIRPDYYPDGASRHYAAVLLKDLQKTA